MKRQFIYACITSIAILIIAWGIKNVVTGTNKKDCMTIGFVYLGDESTAYTDNFIQAQNAIEEKYAGRVKVFAKYNVPEDKAEAALTELAKDKCDIIFSTTYAYGDASKKVAKKYPDTQFCQATCDNANDSPKLKNYHNFMGEIYQGRYVSGIVAGMKLKELISNGIIDDNEAKLGYVGAYENAEVISGFTAFILGVRSIVPTATMEVRYAKSWGNYAVEKELAKKLIEDDCIIISQHSDTMGPAVACEEACKDKAVYHIGYNLSMTDVAPKTSLVSCRINWTPYELAVVKAVSEGKNIEKEANVKNIGNDSWSGFTNSWVQMLDLNTLIAADGTQKKIDETISKIKKGKIKIYYGNYTGTNPNNPLDRVSLENEFIENKDGSAPGFDYILDNIIYIKEN